MQISTKEVKMICKKNLNLYRYCVLHLLATNREALEIYKDHFQINEPYIFQHLLRNGYINIDHKVTNKGFKVLGILNEDNPGKWIDEWVDLFPVGIKSGGYYVKSNAQDCLKKMTRFVKKYPDFDRELIFDVTRKYISNLSMNSYKGMQLAHYFIEKNGISSLATECSNNGDVGQILNDDFGIQNA